MGDEPLSNEERRLLLQLARQAVTCAVRGLPAPEPDLASLPAGLCLPGVCFVTLTNLDGRLRGCIGGLEVRFPLAQDVCEHAAAAALEDYRFAPVTPDELPYICIEISRLTAPTLLEYERPEELLTRLRPLVDGVVLHDGQQRATFLPQVWAKLPDPLEFLSQLCLKLGAPADLWQQRSLLVETYRVEKFHE
jgi:hypothetical protein